MFHRKPFVFFFENGTQLIYLSESEFEKTILCNRLYFDFAIQKIKFSNFWYEYASASHTCRLFSLSIAHTQKCHAEFYVQWPPPHKIYSHFRNSSHTQNKHRTRSSKVNVCMRCFAHCRFFSFRKIFNSIFCRVHIMYLHRSVLLNFKASVNEFISTDKYFHHASVFRSLVSAYRPMYATITIHWDGVETTANEEK